MLLLIILSITFQIQTAADEVHRLHLNKVKSIYSYEILLKIYTTIKDGSKVYNFRRTIHIWQSGNKFRTDHDTPVSDCPSCQYRNITCLNGEGDQSAFLCSYNLANPTEIAASLQKKSTDPKKQANYIIVDARKIAASWKSPIEHFTFTDPESILVSGCTFRPSDH